MLNKYILGTHKIETTEERYNAYFKDAGYIPFKEKEIVVETKKVENQPIVNTKVENQNVKKNK